MHATAVPASPGQTFLLLIRDKCDLNLVATAVMLDAVVPQIRLA